MCGCLFVFLVYLRVISLPGFNIVAQVQLQGPTNIAAVAQQISSGLSNISANVNVNVNNASLGALQGLGNTIGQLNTSLGALVNASNTASGAVSNLGGSMSRTSAGASVVQQSARTATASLKGVTTAFQEAEAAGEQFGKSAGLALRRFAGFTLAAGTVFAVVDSFKHGIEQAILFEREMNKLEQVNAGTVTQIKEVERAISSLSTTFGASSQSLAQAAVLLGSAGLKADDVTKSLEALAKSAASPQFGNLIDTTNGVIAIMSQFKVPASEIEKSLGAINSVSNAFSTESGDLIEAIKRSGGAFRATGGDLNEFLALFTSVRATTRESAESIATGLRTIFTRFQTPQTVNALKEMGINLRFSRTEAEQLGKVNLTDQFVGPYEAVRRLSAALKDLPTTDPRFAAIIDQLGGYRQISRVIPLIQEFGTAQRAYATAQSGALSITAASEKAQESYAVQIAKTKETFLELTRTIVGSEGFRVFLDGLLKIANAAVILLNALGPLIPLLTTLAAIRIGAAIPGFIAGFAGGFRGEQPKRLAIGGVVPGVGNTDTVPAMLTPGEFVVRKESAQRIGYSNLSKLNSGGQVKVKDGVQYLARGGIVLDINGPYAGLFLRGLSGEEKTSNIEYGAGSIKKSSVTKILDNPDIYNRVSRALSLSPRGNVKLVTTGSGYNVVDDKSGGTVVHNIPVTFLGSPEIYSVNKRAAGSYETATSGLIKSAVKTGTGVFLRALSDHGIDTNSAENLAVKSLTSNSLSEILGHAYESSLVGIAGSIGERTGSKDTFDLKNVDPKSRENLSKVFGTNITQPYLDAKLTPSSNQIRDLVKKAVNTKGEGSNQFEITYPVDKNSRLLGVIKGDIEEKVNENRPVSENISIRGSKQRDNVKLARGGIVPGVGDTDSVHAQLMPGEFVIRKSSAQKIGYDALSSFNNFGGQIRKFEQGGSVFDKDVSDQNIKKVTDFFNKLGLSGIDLNKLISRLYFVDKVPSKYGNDPYGKFDLNSRAVLIKAPSYTAKGELVKEGADYETLGHEIFGHALSLRVANLNKNPRLPTSDPSTLIGEVAAQSKEHLYPLVKNKEYRQKEAEKYQKAGFPDLVLDEAFANAMQTYVRLLAVKKGEVPLDNQLKNILTDPKAYSVLYRVHNEIIPLLKQVTSDESPSLNVNLSKLKDTYDQVKGQYLGIGKKFFVSGGPVRMAGGGDPTFLYGKKKERLTYSELQALGLGKEDLEQFKNIGAGELTEVSKIDKNKQEQKLKTLQLPLFPTERFAMIYRGDASTAGLDRIHFSSVKGLKLSGDTETFLSKYEKLPPDGPVRGIRARFDKHVFSQESSQDFGRIQRKINSYLNNLFKEEFPSSTIPLNIKQKTLSDISGGIFETYVSGLSQIPIAGNNETFDISNARIQASEINKVLYPKLQTGLADIKLTGSNNNITSMINKILNYEVAHGGDKAIDTATIGLAPGEALAPPLSSRESLLRRIRDRYTKLGLNVPPDFKAQGGLVDSVPALLTPGEFVINRDSASRIGLAQLNRMNITGRADGGTVQKFARGGPVQPQKFATGGPTGSFFDDFQKALEEIATVVRNVAIQIKDSLTETFSKSSLETAANTLKAVPVKEALEDFANKVRTTVTGKNQRNIETEQFDVSVRDLEEEKSLKLGRRLRNKAVVDPTNEGDPEFELAKQAAIDKINRELLTRAQAEEGLGTKARAQEGSPLLDIQKRLYREFRAGGSSKIEASDLAIEHAEEERQLKLEAEAKRQIVEGTKAVGTTSRNVQGQATVQYQFKDRREIEEAQRAAKREEEQLAQKDKFGEFARKDAEREITSQGGRARLSQQSISGIENQAQKRLTQELLSSEEGRIRSLKLGISKEEIQRLARENVTNALLQERNIITDSITGKRKLKDSENLVTAKNLELAKAAGDLSQEQKETLLASRPGQGGVGSGLAGPAVSGESLFSRFRKNPALLAGAAYSLTAYAPTLLNQAQGGSFEERLPGQIGPRGEVQGDIRSFGGAALSGAGTGFAGGFAIAAAGGGPVGAVVGGVVIGLLAFANALHEQEKQIRAAQLGKALDSLALKINDFNSGKLFGGEAGFGVVGGEFRNVEEKRRAEDETSRTRVFGLFRNDSAEKVIGTEDKSLREKVLPQLPGLLQAQERVISDIFTRQNAGNVRGGTTLSPDQLKQQVDSVLDDFLKAGNGFGKEIVETTARLKNVPYDDVIRETKQQIIAIQNSARVVTNELQARALLSSQLNSLVTFANSLNGAIIALKEFDDKLSLTGQIVSGNVTGGQVNVRGDVTQAVQSADTDTLNKVLTESLGVLGSRLDTLRTPITELNRANRELPGILAQAGSTPRGPLEPGTFGDRVTTLLQNAGFGREITTAITSTLDTQFKDPAALQQALTRDIGGLSKQLVKEYQPLLDAVANISKSVQDETNKFIGSLSQSSRFLEEINANLQQGATLSLQYSRTTAENQAIMAGRRGDAGSFISLQQLESPYNQLQQRLAPNVANPFDTGAITRQLDKVNEGLRRQDEIRRTSIGTTAGDKAAQQFEKLAFESNNLQKALKNLADVSSRAAGIQEKLGQLQQDRESRLSFGERFITSDAAGQGQIQRGLALINLTAQTKSAEGLTDPDRRLLFETLHSLGNARIPAAGNITAKDLTEQLVESFGGGIFKPQIGDQQKELDLRQTLIQYFDAGRQANEALVNKENEGYDKFIQDLTRAHTIFLAKLEQIELQTVQTTLQRQKEQADVEKGLATSQKTAADEIRKKTGIGGLPTDDQNKFVDALLKNQDEIRKLADLQSRVTTFQKPLDERALTKLSPEGEELSNLVKQFVIPNPIGQNLSYSGLDQTKLIGLLERYVYQNQTNLGIRNQDVTSVATQLANVLNERVGSGLSSTDVKGNLLTQLENIPDIIENLEAVQKSRESQLTDLTSSQLKLVQTLSAGKPDLKGAAETAIKNFPQIAPALSQFQSGEQFGKVTDRLDKASKAVEGFGTKIEKVDDSLDILERKLRSFNTPEENLKATAKDLLDVILGNNKKASGGIISGAGSSSALAHGTDTVPAMLTPGEFVVRREAVSKHLPLLLAINDGHLTGEDRGEISHFQFGGLALDRVQYAQSLRELRQAAAVINRYRYTTAAQAQLQFAATPQAQFAQVRQQNLAQQATLFPGTTEIEDLNHTNNADKNTFPDNLDDAYQKAKQLLFDLAVNRRKAFGPEIQRLGLAATTGPRSQRATSAEQRTKLLNAIEVPISQLRDTKANTDEQRLDLINLLPSKLFDQLKSQFGERANLDRQLKGYDTNKLREEYKDKAVPYIKKILANASANIVQTQTVLSGVTDVDLNDNNKKLLQENLEFWQQVQKDYTGVGYPIEDRLISTLGDNNIKNVIREAQLDLSPRHPVGVLAAEIGRTKVEDKITEEIEKRAPQNRESAFTEAVRLAAISKRLTDRIDRISSITKGSKYDRSLLARLNQEKAAVESQLAQNAIASLPPEVKDIISSDQQIAKVREAVGRRGGQELSIADIPHPEQFIPQATLDIRQEERRAEIRLGAQKSLEERKKQRESDIEVERKALRDAGNLSRDSLGDLFDTKVHLKEFKDQKANFERVANELEQKKLAAKDTGNFAEVAQIDSQLGKTFVQARNEALQTQLDELQTKFHDEDITNLERRQKFYEEKRLGQETTDSLENIQSLTNRDTLEAQKKTRETLGTSVRQNFKFDEKDYDKIVEKGNNGERIQIYPQIEGIKKDISQSETTISRLLGDIQYQAVHNTDLKRPLKYIDILSKDAYDALKSKGLYNYASGGIVPGFGNTDTVPAMLTPGEFVLNRAATSAVGVSNLNKINYMQTGGVVTGGANAGGSLLSSDAIASISNFSGAATGLSRALTTFNGNSEGLTSALKAFPKTITGTFTHNVNVNHNGLEILSILTPSIGKIALETVNTILGNYIQQNLPGAPPLNKDHP